MTVTGTTFDRMRVTPKDDALINQMAMSDQDFLVKWYGDDWKTEQDGLNLTIKTGAAVIAGRLIRVTEPESLIIPASSEGYVVITIDLTQQNTSTGTPGQDDYTPVNNQVKIETVTELVTGDISEDGSIYMFPIWKYKSTTNSFVLGSGEKNIWEIRFSSNWENKYTDNHCRIRDHGDYFRFEGYCTPKKAIPAGVASEIFQCAPRESAYGGMGYQPMSLQIASLNEPYLYNMILDLSSNSMILKSCINLRTGAMTQVNAGWVINLGMIIIPKYYNSKKLWVDHSIAW